MTNDKTPAANSVYVSIAGAVVNRRSLLLRNFVLHGKVITSNPLLHIHAKRCRQYLWRLFLKKSQPENQKERIQNV